MAVTYQQAGVDIDAGDDLVERIKPHARRTMIPEALAGVGGFASLCAIPSGLEEPILVSGTDGVGTKLLVAFATGVHGTIGQDLVAMCANDVLTTGARPLFFLDYFASGKLDVAVGEQIVAGIADGCQLAGCALLGGETAELPGMYPEGEYDLAGFCVGVVDKKKLLGSDRVNEGDELVCIASTGLHSNGYSLARRVLQKELGLSFSDRHPLLSGTVGETLLTPTRIYSKAVAALLKELGGDLHAMSHITGGGVTGNLPRVLPDGTKAVMAFNHEWPAIFRVIAEGGPVETEEMRRTFNLGVGMIAVVAAGAGARAVAALEAAGERAWVDGHVAAATPGAEAFVEIRD